MLYASPWDLWPLTVFLDLQHGFDVILVRRDSFLFEFCRRVFEQQLDNHCVIVIVSAR